MVSLIKRYMPQKIKYFIGHNISRFQEIAKTNLLYMFVMFFLHRENSLKYNKKSKKVILVNTPNHPNLGDQAIAIAEVEFINKNYPDYELVELYDDIFFKVILRLKRSISDGDLFFCHGGGNMGTDYFWCEKVRRTVIKMFPNNKIIIFPQTIFYKDDIKSQKELEKSINIYNKHDNLMICAREQKSFEFLNDKFNKCRIMLVPDIVLYLRPKIAVERSSNKVLFCFRNDREMNMKESEKEIIARTVKESGDEGVITDTVVSGHIDTNARKQILMKKIEEFAGAKLVITDRLHGMVFSYITDTPCIVFGNYNHKVEGVFDWFVKEKIQSVAFQKDTSNFYELYKVMRNISCKNDNQWTEMFYNQITTFSKQTESNENKTDKFADVRK